MKKLKTVDADTLLYQPLEKPGFVVDGLIPTGLSLFCGAQKIGKSWLMLKLCLCVSEGKPFGPQTLAAFTPNCQAQQPMAFSALMSSHRQNLVLDFFHWNHFPFS